MTSTIGAVAGALAALLGLVLYLFKRFPGKSTSEKEESGEQGIVDEIKKDEETGRPQG